MLSSRVVAPSSTAPMALTTLHLPKYSNLIIQGGIEFHNSKTTEISTSNCPRTLRSDIRGVNVIGREHESSTLEWERGRVTTVISPPKTVPDLIGSKGKPLATEDVGLPGNYPPGILRKSSNWIEDRLLPLRPYSPQHIGPGNPLSRSKENLHLSKNSRKVRFSLPAKNIETQSSQSAEPVPWKTTDTVNGRQSLKSSSIATCTPVVKRHEIKVKGRVSKSLKNGTNNKTSSLGGSARNLKFRRGKVRNIGIRAGYSATHRAFQLPYPRCLLLNGIQRFIGGVFNKFEDLVRRTEHSQVPISTPTGSNQVSAQPCCSRMNTMGLSRKSRWTMSELKKHKN